MDGDAGAQKSAGIALAGGAGSSSNSVNCSRCSGRTADRPGRFRHDWRGRWAKCAVMAGPERSTSGREQLGHRTSSIS
jgi:hypothetical protein